MTGPLRLTVSDVLFVHWPVESADLRSHLPDPLEPDTFEGTAWISAVALRVDGARFGPLSIGDRPFGQLNVRTYVRSPADGDSGVYFLSLDAGSRFGISAGRYAFGLPFYRADVSTGRVDGTRTFRSRRTRSGSPARFDARYRPAGGAYRADPGSTEAALTERYRYYVARSGSDVDDGCAVSEISHDPWTLRPVGATIETNTLFDALGLPRPTGEARFHYSPGCEIGIGLLPR